MKRILLFLTLCFSIIETIAQNYSVDVSDNGELKYYKVKSDFSTNIQRLKVNFSIAVSEEADVCLITFSQMKPTTFIDGIGEKIIVGGEREDDNITKKSYATLFFSDGTSCKVACVYAQFNAILKLLAGCSDFEIMFQLGTTFKGNVTVGDKMKRTNITGISMFGKRVNFVNFSSVKAISAITKKIEDDSFKEGYYECDGCNGTGLCLRCGGTGRSTYGSCVRCGGNGVCNDCKGHKEMYYYKDREGNVKKQNKLDHERQNYDKLLEEEAKSAAPKFGIG